MNLLNYTITCIDILAFIYLTMIMIKRVVCRAFIIRRSTLNFNKFKRLIIQSTYYSDIIILIACLTAVCKLTNSFIVNTDLLIGNIYWLLFRNLILIGLLIKYKDSQPKLIKHLLTEFKELIYANINNFQKRWFKTSN